MTDKVNTEENLKVADTNTENQESIQDAAEETSTDKESDLKQKVQELEEQVQEHKNNALLAMADTENARRRASMDVEKAHKYGQEKLINELLPIIDNLEQAIENIEKLSADNQAAAKSIAVEYMSATDAIAKLSTKSDTAFNQSIEGLQLTLKLFTDALNKSNVSIIDPQDEVFDSNLHEALSMAPSADVPENNILTVIQKGYKLADRVIRPAKVIVSKG
jgi:molecular chaperone GrpE